MFGERIDRRSEPDLIVDDCNVLAFVENKWLSGNRTKPSEPDNPKLYETGGGRWFRDVFGRTVTFKEVAVVQQMYELMRLWLLGSWIAHQAKKEFFLINVVREGMERDIQDRFGQFALVLPQRRFIRTTWEQIHHEFVRPEKTDDARLLRRYFAEKTIGYRPVGRTHQNRLSRAFCLSD